MKRLPSDVYGSADVNPSDNRRLRIVADDQLVHVHVGGLYIAMLRDGWRVLIDAIEEAMGTDDTFAAALADFEATQNRYGAFGACDTEPRGVFKDLLADALRQGPDIPIPETVSGWQLYERDDDPAGAEVAARELAEYARRVVRAASANPKAAYAYIG